MVAVAAGAAAVAKAREGRRQRLDELRVKLETAIAAAEGRWDGRVSAAEIAAGRAVIAAMELDIRHVDLSEMADCPVAELRKWAQLARQVEAEAQPAAQDGSLESPRGADGGAGLTTKPRPDEAARVATGLAVTRPNRVDEGTS